MDDQLKPPDVGNSLTNPCEVGQQPNISPQNNYLLLVLLVALITATVFGLGGYYLGRSSRNFDTPPADKNNIQNSISTNELVTPTAIPTAIPTPTQVLIPSPQSGFKQYVDEQLKYGFSYPAVFSVTKCADIPCASIKQMSLKIEPLETFQLSSTDPKASLLATDLYCDAGGPMGDIDCKNTKVDDFTNSLGYEGFKVYRTVTVTGTGGGISPGTYQDTAYVFPLKRTVKGQGLLNFAGILLAVDNPIESNLASLEEIANSFFNY